MLEKFIRWLFDSLGKEKPFSPSSRETGILADERVGSTLQGSGMPPAGWPMRDHQPSDPGIAFEPTSITSLDARLLCNPAEMRALGYDLRNGVFLAQPHRNLRDRGIYCGVESYRHANMLLRYYATSPNFRIAYTLMNIDMRSF
jgi:hypothetical protein